mmetsp:Transcript_14722/g.18489  ORF Transcript_14722/g.18489 Transcript_14722/m.18489 type:complete len:191 (+) Transcript_14722:197-769(+)
MFPVTHIRLYTGRITAFSMTSRSWRICIILYKAGRRKTIHSCCIQKKDRNQHEVELILALVAVENPFDNFTCRDGFSFMEFLSLNPEHMSFEGSKSTPLCCSVWNEEEPEQSFDSTLGSLTSASRSTSNSEQSGGSSSQTAGELTEEKIEPKKSELFLESKRTDEQQPVEVTDVKANAYYGLTQQQSFEF